jgi:hypothetical protein
VKDPTRRRLVVEYAEKPVRKALQTVGPSPALKGEGVDADEGLSRHKGERGALQGHSGDRKRLLPGP